MRDISTRLLEEAYNQVVATGQQTPQTAQPVQKQAQNNELEKMVQALQQNPQAAAVLANRLKQLGAPVEPIVQTEANKPRSTGLRKLAMMLLAAGIAASTITNTAKAAGPVDSVVDMIEWGDEQRLEFERMLNDVSGYDPSKDTQEGTVNAIVYKQRGTETFRKYRKDYLDALRNGNAKEAQRIELLSTQHAWNLLKQFGQDYEQQNARNFIPSMIAGITFQGVDKTNQLIKDNPEIFVGVKTYGPSN